MEKQQYKYQELAVLLDIPLNTLYKLRKEGRGPKTQVIGRHFREFWTWLLGTLFPREDPAHAGKQAL